MESLGRGRGGVVVMTNGDALPEGTAVRIEPVMVSWRAAAAEQMKVAEQAAADAERRGEPPILEKLLRHAGTAKGLPSDLALNHDHYLHGLPKK